MELQLGSVPVCERPQGLPRGSWGDGRPSFWCSKDPTTPDIYEVLTAHPLHLYALPSHQAGQRGALAVGGGCLGVDYQPSGWVGSGEM